MTVSKSAEQEATEFSSGSVSMEFLRSVVEGSENEPGGFRLLNDPRLLVKFGYLAGYADRGRADVAALDEEANR